MRNDTLVLAALVSATLLAACGPGGPARPQLTEITDSDGTRTMMSYTADKLSTVKTVDKDGKVTSDVSVTYDGLNLKTVTAGEPGKTPTIYTYTYNDTGLLTKVAAKTDSTEYSNSFTYSEGKLSRTELVIKAGEVGSSSTTDYTYDDNLKPKTSSNTTVSSLGIFSVTVKSSSTYTYDPATLLLKEIQVTTDDNSTLTQLSYDEQNRLQKVTEGTSIYTVEYGTDGNVSRTLHQSGSATTFKSYKYQSGTLTGIIGNPLVNYGGWFDLMGKELPHDQQYVTSSLMGLQE